MSSQGDAEPGRRRRSVRATRSGRPLHHHGYVQRPFNDVCDDLAVQGPEIVRAATLAAANFAADLAGYLEDRLGYFDRDEPVTVVVGDLDRTPQSAILPIEWRADRTRRLLPNVTAALHAAPIISTGRGATTEVTLQGTFAPASPSHRGPVERVLTRRLVDATLHTFVRHLVDDLGRATSDQRP